MLSARSIRRALLRRFPYCVFYIVERERVVVLEGLQLTTNSVLQSIGGTLLAAGGSAQRWRSAPFVAAEARSASQPIEGTP